MLGTYAAGFWKILFCYFPKGGSCDFVFWILIDRILVDVGTGMSPLPKILFDWAYCKLFEFF